MQKKKNLWNGRHWKQGMAYLLMLVVNPMLVNFHIMQGHFWNEGKGEQSVVQNYKFPTQKGQISPYPIIFMHHSHHMFRYFTCSQWFLKKGKFYVNIYKYNWKNKEQLNICWEEVLLSAFVAAMASTRAALASSRIPTYTRLPTKTSHSFPSQYLPKVSLSLIYLTVCVMQRCMIGFWILLFGQRRGWKLLNSLGYDPMDAWLLPRMVEKNPSLMQWLSNLLPRLPKIMLFLISTQIDHFTPYIVLL